MSDSAYQDFLTSKRFSVCESGFDANTTSRCWSVMFDYQKDIIKWACRRGKAAIFADTGLGKSLMQLTWADQVAKHTGRRVLIVAPLAVSFQFITEAEKFGIKAGKAGSDCMIHVINYEQLHKINANEYAGVALDESSILKGMDGKLRKMITETFKRTAYKLSCTATPSPNDFVELGTQAEFLGIMSQVEMLAMFFIHDGSDTSKWRLKGHGRKKFFEWLSTWAVFISKPSDLGYQDDSHHLPDLIYHEHVIESGIKDGLFAPIAQGLKDRNAARKTTVGGRVALAAEIVNSIDDQCVVWCHLNDEADQLSELIHGAVEVRGSDDPDHKAESMIGFANGSVKRLVTKPKIAGFGMNWQSCNQMVFVGLSDSWEQFYQAVRRCWRFGQTRPVHVHIISADIEGGVVANIKHKEQINQHLKLEMIEVMKDKTLTQLGKAAQEKSEYTNVVKMEIPKWLA